MSRTVTAGDTLHSTLGLTNARTRIVGNRTGFLPDAVVEVVRVSRGSRAAIARAVGRVASVITAPGWFVLAIIPMAFVAGYGLGWLELVVAAWAMLVAVGVAALYLVGRTALDIDLRMISARVVVGQPAVGVVAVRNPTRTRLLGAVVEVPIGSGLVDIAIPGLARDGSSSHEFLVPTARRGVVPIGPVRSVRADPIGLVRRELVWTGQTEVFVHPRTIAVPSMSTGLVHDLEGNATRDLSASDMAFHALREYQPGDERRSIHWKSTAKTGRYMVRQFEETRRSHLVIALTLADEDYASDDEFELAVSVAGSLGARAIRDTRDVTVVVGQTTPDFARTRVLATRPLSTRSAGRLLDDLAVVDLAASSLAITDVARVTAESVAGVSVAFLICGSPVTATQLRAASAAFPAGVETIAVSCDPDHIPGLRRVAGLTIVTIGYLEDLQRSLARSRAS